MSSMIMEVDVIVHVHVENNNWLLMLSLRPGQY